MVTNFKIENDVPAPNIHPRCKYPFDEMQPGASFFVEGDAASRLSNASGAFARSRKDGRKFAVRKVDGGARIWRIA